MTPCRISVVAGALCLSACNFMIGSGNGDRCPPGATSPAQCAAASSTSNSTAPPTNGTLYCGDVSDEEVFRGEATPYQDSVQTPEGKVSASCVRSVASGSRILEDGVTTERADGTRLRFAPCAQPPVPTLAHGYPLEATAQGTSFSYLTGQWTVPEPPPSSNGQTLYLWNGLEPTDSSCVIQPVLGWYGPTTGWELSSWVCCPGTSTGCYESTPVAASPGDSITGTMSLDGSGNWTIYSEDNTTGQSTSLVVAASAVGGTQDYVIGAILEVYDISSCADYPGSSVMTFTNTSVTDAGTTEAPELNWFYINDGCGENVTTSAGSASLYISNTCAASGCCYGG